MSEWTDEKQRRWMELEKKLVEHQAMSIGEDSDLSDLREEFCEHSYRQLTGDEAEPEKRLWTDDDVECAFNEGVATGMYAERFIQKRFEETETGKKILGEARTNTAIHDPQPEGE